MAGTDQTLRLRMGAATHDREVELPLPSGWTATVYSPRDRAAMTDSEVEKALERPVGAEPISIAARGALGAVLLVDDFRRPTPAEKLCRLVLDQLQTAGIPPKQVSIILGNGAHRTMTRREVRRRLRWLCDAVGHVISHDAYSPRVTYMGVTSAGTPVLVNEAAAAADFSVTISTVYPHRLVAWGGGAKMVLPGICHVSSIHGHHSRFADPSIYHGLYHGLRKQFDQRPALAPPEPTDESLRRAAVFWYSPQWGRGFVPPDRNCYGDSDWPRLMAAMGRRFKRAKVAVFPAAPLQLPRIV